ncbi:MAG: hypothetical protein ACAI37_22020, partial [Chthoniobacter sp.]
HSPSLIGVPARIEATSSSCSVWYMSLSSPSYSQASGPVIACSGVGRYEHYVDAIRAGASAVAAANIWHFKELSDRGGKRALAKGGVDIRL